MSIKLNPNEKYIIALLKSILNSSIPPEKPEDVSFEKVYSMAKYHNIANMLFYAIEKLENKPAPELLKKWREISYKCVSRDIIQKLELDKLLNSFEKNQIKNIVLKGFELKKLYPKSDMRFMSDIDILISKKDAEKVLLLMNELGYKTISYGKEKDDVYFKDPIMNVEIHNALFDVQYKEYNSLFKPLEDMKNIIPKTEYQRCIVHQVRNTLKYVSYKDRKHFADDLKTIYQAPSEQIALKNLEKVTEKWEKIYPNSMKSWSKNWDAISPIFKFSMEVRKVIYTTNAIESLNSVYRRLNSQRSVFPSDISLLKSLYLATFEATKKWTSTLRNWGKIYGELQIMFEERLS